MTISVDWANTKVISVEKSDMVLVQATPIEVYDLDLDSFRLTLLDLQDDPEGRPWQRTYRHNTEVLLGGLTYARTIEILEPYTVTFEDGQYAVNLTGANSNVGDRVNVNQVSVRSQNSAGMTSSPDIEYSSFNGGVTYNSESPYSGTAFPVGTPRQPVNNISDALLIAYIRGFHTVFIEGDATATSEITLDGTTFIGSGKTKSLFTLEDSAIVENCTYVAATVTGYLDGASRLKGCVIDNLNYMNGHIEKCILSPGTITLGGSNTAHFLNCFSGVPGTGTPTIDMGGSGQPLALRNYNGGIRLINKTGPESVSIDLNSGQVKLNMATVTNGTIVARGIGKLIDDITGEHIHSGTYGSLVILNELVNVPEIVDQVWDEDLEVNYSAKEVMRLLAAAAAGKLNISGNTVTIRDMNDGLDRITAITDTNGNRTEVTHDVS